MTETAHENSLVKTTLAGKYLTFTLHGESYGVAVLKIREIVRFSKITTVPQMPSYVCGVINLRGKIIPVMDLRIRLGVSEANISEHACIMVVQFGDRDKITQTGLVVDAVEEVVNIPAADIEPAPDFGTAISTDYILGMAKVKGIVKTLLNLDRLLLS